MLVSDYLLGLRGRNQGGGHPSTPTEETYFCMFSSAVPVQVVPSIWQAVHDGMARVIERMSATTSELSSSVSPTGDPPPAIAVGSGYVRAEPPMLSLPFPGGRPRMKEPETSSKTPPDKIQSCQDKSSEMAGETGSNGSNPRVRISWMMNREGNDT